MISIARKLCLLAALFLTFPALAEEPTGQVILTVSGNITNPNRGALDDFDDAIFNSQDAEFEKAHGFDLASLEALGMKKITVSYEDWPSTFTLEGPLLSDVIKAAGGKGETLVARALDGYAPEIPMADLEKYPVVLALKKDGKYMGLGGLGPAWIVYPRNDFPELQEEDTSKYVWSVFLIEVK